MTPPSDWKPAPRARKRLAPGRTLAAPTRPMAAFSDKRLAYLASDVHEESYGVAEAYCVGHALDAPGRCFGPLTPHHTLKRSVGGLEYAEQNAPVVTLCSSLNDDIESKPETRAWALRTKFTRNGVEYPFLVLAKGVTA